MRRLAIGIICLGFVACGGGESEKAGSEALREVEGTAREAAKTAEEAVGSVGAAAEAAMEEPKQAASPDVQKCLDLVKAGQFGEAVPVCMRAAGVDPDNQEVQAALTKAQSEAATAAGAEGAAAEAQGAAEGLMEGMPEKKLP